IMKLVIESESQLIKLDELLESTQYGYTASAQQNGSHRLLRITDIQGGEVNWRDVPFCDCERPEKYIVQKGDILVARTGGTTGKSFLINDSNAPKNVIYASYLIKLRADKEKVLPEYLNLFMNSYIYWSQITEMKSGSAQPNVNANKLKELVIPYCSLDKQVELVERIEQNKELNLKISKACSEYEKVKHVEEIIQEQKLDIDLYRRLIIQDAIQGKIVEQNENDEPASALLEKIKLEKEKLIKEKKIKKEKSLPQITDEEKPFELPSGWEWGRFNEVLSVKNGISKRAGTEGEEQIVLRLADIKGNKVSLQDCRKIMLTSKELETYKVDKRGLLFIRVNGSFDLVGKAVLYQDDIP
ncbi:restriction endonuclease subunit S, partial [Bacillus toyonensis]|uniref:restriction endonuclease subunit S n=1 Tax=Bacillus toyonensis TaxID=155322 RepID=UPI002FFF0E04